MSIADNDTTVSIESVSGDLLSDYVWHAFDSVQYRMEQHADEIRPFVAWLCSRNGITDRPLRNVLEIGVRRGGTAALWHALSVGKVIGIDWTGVDSLGIDETLQLGIRMQKSLDRYTFVNGDSHLESTERKVVELLGGEVVDLLFLDGDHSLAGISQDWYMYSPLVSRGGVIAMHDIVDTPTTRAAKQGVAKFWQRLAGDKREFSVCGEWGGIGAVVV